MPPRHHAPDEARRPRLDPHLPGRAGVEEACRSPHGLGQGVAKIKPGRILFEIDGVDVATAKEAMRLGAAKLSIATKFVQRTL